MMKHAGYHIFVAAARVITLLPMRALFILSDILCPVMYHLVRYRRSVVEMNLKNAFPEKSNRERKAIARKFYRHLTDMIFETLKAMRFTPEEMNRRFNATDRSLTDRFFNEGRDVVALTSHYGNWEWISGMQLNARHRVVTIYKPLSDKMFDQYLLKLRERFGVILTPMSRIARELATLRAEKRVTLSGIVADQRPPRNDNAYWTTFLNQETAFYRGAEKIARKYDAAVIFIHIARRKRGYYELEYRLISEYPGEEETDAITQRYAEMLEEEIRREPQYWLWSHRRWKYKRQEEV